MMLKKYLDTFVAMEKERIIPFGKFSSKKEAEDKVRLVLRYFLDSLKPGDKLYYMKHVFEQILKCQTGKLIGTNNSEMYAEEAVHIDRIEKLWVRESCNNSVICIECSTEYREDKVERLNLILAESKRRGEYSVMVTIVAPLYLNEKISEREKIRRFYDAIKSIFKENKKEFEKNFHICGGDSPFFEIPVKITDFKMYLHVHFVCTFSSKEEQKLFLEVFETFKEKVYRAMGKQFDIKDKDYYRKNCAYVNIEENPETGEKNIVELKDVDYLKKSYGFKKDKRFEKWAELRTEHFSKLENFDREANVFREVSEEDEKEIRRFYSEVMAKSGEDGKCFCLRYDELVQIGGKITKGDLALKETDYERYKRVMHLKTWATKLHIEQLSCLYEPGKRQIAYPLIRISTKHYQKLGGAEVVKAILKEEKNKQRLEKELKRREEDELKRRNEEIESIESEEKRKEVKSIVKDNEIKLEEVKNERIRLVEEVGLNYEKLDLETFYRRYRILRVGTRLHRYIALGLVRKMITNLNWLDCIKNERGGLDIKNGLKRLYEVTEEYGLEREQIFISEYIFKDNEYAKYFPKKVESNKIIEKRLKDRLGITLSEFDNIRYYYRLNELKQIVDLLIENSKKRESISREEFEGNVERILQKMRGIRRRRK